jgi:hypothetical protein
MATIMDELKLVIDTNIPTEREELIWIINNIGKHIFNNNLWEENNIYKNEKEIYPHSLDGIIKIIDNVINDNDKKTELIKYLFGKSLNKLNNA